MKIKSRNQREENTLERDIDQDSDRIQISKANNAFNYSSRKRISIRLTNNGKLFGDSKRSWTRVKILGGNALPVQIYGAQTYKG